MAAGTVRLVTDASNTGKYIDTSELTVGGNTAERQNVCMADPATAAAVSSVGNSRPASGAYGLTVRPLMPSNGTQDMPTMDAAARAGYHIVTDGADVLNVIAEDTPHTSGDTGLQVFSVRSDTAAALAGSDGDYQPLITDASGRLWCNVGNTVAVSGTFWQATQPVSGTFWQATQPVSLASVPSHAVTNAGTFAVQESGAALTSLQLIDDVVFSEDAAAVSGDKGVPALAVRRDAAASSSGTDGDYSTLNTDSSGRLWARAQYDGPAWTSAYGVAGDAFTSADASAAAVAVTSAPTSTQKLVITDVTVSVGAAMTVTLTEETSGKVHWKLYFAAAGTVTIRLESKRKLSTADKKLMVQTSGAGNVSVMADYYSEA